MKLWPPEITKRYPFDPAGPARSLARPWWVMIGEAKHQLSPQSHPYLGCYPGWLRSDGRAAEEAESLLEIDREHPLPHPGFRAGQVWSDDLGNARVLQFVDHSSKVFTGLSVSLQYLVYDPCCPWLAPWAPLETS